MRSCPTASFSPRPGDGGAARDLAILPSEKTPVLAALVQAGADASLLDLAEKLNFTPGPT